MIPANYLFIPFSTPSTASQCQSGFLRVLWKLQVHDYTSFFLNYAFFFPSQVCWCMPVIPALWKTEAGRLQVQLQPGQVRPSLKIINKIMSWRCSSVWKPLQGSISSTEKRKRIFIIEEHLIIPDFSRNQKNTKMEKKKSNGPHQPACF